MRTGSWEQVDWLGIQEPSLFKGCEQRSIRKVIFFMIQVIGYMPKRSVKSFTSNSGTCHPSPHFDTILFVPLGSSCTQFATCKTDYDASSTTHYLSTCFSTSGFVHWRITSAHSRST